MRVNEACNSLMIRLDWSSSKEKIPNFSRIGSTIPQIDLLDLVLYVNNLFGSRPRGFIKQARLIASLNPRGVQRSYGVKGQI